MRQAVDHSNCDPGSPTICSACSALWQDVVTDAVPILRVLRGQLAAVATELESVKRRSTRKPRGIPEYVGVCVSCYPHQVHAGNRCPYCDCDVDFRARSGPKTTAPAVCPRCTHPSAAHDHETGECRYDDGMVRVCGTCRGVEVGAEDLRRPPVKRLQKLAAEMGVTLTRRRGAR